jgi:hypothetical protein
MDTSKRPAGRIEEGSNMRTVHLIHGFNEGHKLQRPKIARLKPLLEARGLRVKVHDYGKWDLVATRNNENIARLIYPHVNDGDTLIGFSNGAAVIAHLEDFGVRAKRVILIQPALSKRWVPNHYAKHVVVFWNKGDDVTVAGKWWRRVTGMLPWRWQDKHNWGEMGDTGYTGQDTRFIQYQTDADASDENQQKLPKVSGHGDWQDPENIAWWQIIVNHA